MTAPAAAALLMVLLPPLAWAEPLLRSCEPIRVELCSGLGYNQTGMPNLGGNDLQQEADYTLKSFSPLIQYGCSSQLKLFLCAVYVPMCTEKVANPIGPCRGLCESVRARCYPVLRGFGFPWPDALNCSRFPIENNHEHMCMEGPRDRQVDVAAPVDPAVRRFDCPAKGCAPAACAEALPPFDDAEKGFAEVWVTVWAMICFVISLGAALTLCIGGGRVRARPLINLTMCCCLVSAGWALRMFSGRMPPFCHDNIPKDGLSNVNCAFVFLLLYYFGMAAKAWWVCLCIWWLARVGLCWSPEKMRNLSSFLHVMAWGVPAAQTVTALVRRDVDSDNLTGTCYIGNRKDSTLLALVLIPDAIYFFSGITILLIGCVHSLRKPHPAAAAPLTAVAPRKGSDFLGVICTMYAIPIFCILSTVYYEYTNREKWLSGEKRPALWAFLLRHVMSLFMGVSMIVWIWSAKTVTAWRAVLRRLGPRKPPPAKVQALPPLLRYVPAPPPPHHPIPPSAMSNGSRHSSSRSHTHRKPRLHHPRSAGETII